MFPLDALRYLTETIHNGTPMSTNDPPLSCAILLRTMGWATRPSKGEARGLRALS